MSHKARFCLFCIFAMAFSGWAQAQGAAVCGDSPPVANETLKADIKGKAQLLTKYVGDAELGGQIQTSRTEIFSKYPDAEKSRSNAYFEYQVCILIMSDTTRSNVDKLKSLEDSRREFNKPISYNISIQSGVTFIDNTTFGPVNGPRSTIDLLVDGDSILDGIWRLNKPFGTHLLHLDKGEHTFLFDVNIYASEEHRRVQDSCSGTFVVNQSGIYRPHIAIEPRADISGAITECSLNRQT